MHIHETINRTFVSEERRSTHSRTKMSGAALALTGVFLAGCGSSSHANSNSVPSPSNSEPSPVQSALSGTIAPIPTEAVVSKPGPAVLLKGSAHREVEQFGAGTFTDFQAATGPGPELPKGGIIEVDCLATGPVDAAPSAKGKWYHITSPAQLAGYYAAANTFENGDTSGPASSQPAVDPKVPACPPVG